MLILMVTVSLYSRKSNNHRKGKHTMAHALKIIHTDGQETNLNGHLDLITMQSIVGGYIEIVPSNVPGRSLVVNEEGMINNLPRNEAAYKLLHPDFDWGKQPGFENFCLFGNVIVIENDSE